METVKNQLFQGPPHPSNMETVKNPFFQDTHTKQK